ALLRAEITSVKTVLPCRHVSEMSGVSRDPVSGHDAITITPAGVQLRTRRGDTICLGCARS
ncbi:MAG: hypothetical protein ABJA82_09855, partial [Myxococcales bacterium]